MCERVHCVENSRMCCAFFSQREKCHCDRFFFSFWRLRTELRYVVLLDFLPLDVISPHADILMVLFTRDFECRGEIPITSNLRGKLRLGCLVFHRARPRRPPWNGSCFSEEILEGTDRHIGCWWWW